jgi:hypothetical protein
MPRGLQLHTVSTSPLTRKPLRLLLPLLPLLLLLLPQAT